MTEREALKLALTVLEAYAISYDDGDEAITAIKEVLAQPERTWVGLTDEEFQWIYDHGRTPVGMMEMAEARLKEKNT